MKTQISVVDSHHKVLSIWSEYRASLSSSPRLITLDHHTDTSKPFRNHLQHLNAEAAARQTEQWLSAIDFNDPASVLQAQEKLSHDEHIVTAIAADIISSAFVVAHNAQDTGVSVYKQHKIICRSVERDANRSVATREDCDRVLESEFLEEVELSFNQTLNEAGEAPLLMEKYILDIDLDYLNTLKSVEPKDSSYLRSLAQGAGLITIATEAHHVAHLALDKELTSPYLLDKLMQLLN